MPPTTIDAERFGENFETLAAIGATPDDGCHRPAMSEADIEARALLSDYVARCGFDYHIDGAGNQSAVLRCGRADAPTILIGSHLDTVPNGGRYDGALGVLAALEILETVRDAGESLRVDLEAINFTDEEGTHIGMLGSRAAAGGLTTDDLSQPNSGADALEQGLAHLGISPRTILSAIRTANAPAAYLELHIEQGPILIDSDTDIGVVTSIVGLRRHKVTFHGAAVHAGTTPMEARRDAGRGASAFAAAAHELVLSDFDGCRANIGAMRFWPGAFNIVPEQVEVLLEFRAPDEARLQALDQALRQLANDAADRCGLTIQAVETENIRPSELSSELQDDLNGAAVDMGLTSQPMISGAGHDAQSWAGVCPSGMIFIPSLEGISHAPQENSRWQDCINGANTLLAATLRVAARLSEA